MKRGTLFITGASGLVGRYLLERLPANGPLALACRNPAVLPALPPGSEVVAGDLRSVETYRDIGRIRPERVIHAAALTDPDLCERDPEGARAANVEATRRLAESVRQSCQRFVLCSTDLVFDGRRSGYREEDVPAPLLAYGRTKRAAEEAALRVLGDKLVVIRLALLYGWSPDRGLARKTFLQSMLEAAARGEPARLFVDQFRSPLYVEDAASGILQVVVLPDAPPVLHWAGPERVSRYELGVAALQGFGLDPSLAVPARMTEVPSSAPRPADVSLNIERALGLGLRCRSVGEGIAAMRSRVQLLA